MVFTEVSADTNSIVFSATDKANGTLTISDLVVGDVTVSVGGSPQTLGTLTYSAANDQYTLTPYSTFDTGTYTLSYAKPSSSSLFYELYADLSGTIS